jgi:short-subunit dehydrogenase
MGSMLGVMPEPYVSAYVATKFAIRGLSACLRQELREFPDIHVCTVLPAAVDTPIYRKAGNYYRRKARSIFPVYSPERVARTVVRLAARPTREVRVGGFAYLLEFASRLAPGLLERFAGRLAPSLQFENDPTPETSGNLFESTGPHAVAGGWTEYWRGRIFGSGKVADK